jgi:hypothetical protein
MRRENGAKGCGGRPVVAQGRFSWYSQHMEQTPFELTPAQKGLLATLSRETGKPIPALLAEALAVLQEHERLAHDHKTSNGHEAAAPAAEETPRPFWKKALEASLRIPDEELDRLPADLAAQVDHYIYGTPKR